MSWRQSLAALATGLAALSTSPIGAQPAEAAGWCALIYGSDGGYVTCDYRSREQCLAALSGVGGICHENPAAGGRRMEGVPPPARRVR